MYRSRIVVPLVAVVVGLIAVGGWALRRPSTPSPRTADTEHKPAEPPPRKVRHQSSVVGGSAYLVRVKSGAPATPPDEFWAGLFEEMARDPATAEVLRRLFGGLRVELVVLATPPTRDAPILQAKPGPGFDVVIRVCNRGPHVVRSAQGNTKAGPAVPIEYLVGTLSVACVIDADPPANLAGGAPEGDSATTTAPDPFEALKVATEDYLSRHSTGWQGVYIGSFGEDAEFNRVAEHEGLAATERRKDLDSRIETLARRYRDYLAALR